MVFRGEEVLGDTNLLLRSVDEGDPLFETAVAAIDRTLDAGDRIVVARQSLAELWAVATRPVGSPNGLGYAPADARRMVDLLRRRFPVLPEPDEALDLWLDLVTRYGVSGKTTHDARLVATMLANGVGRILTFNGAHFARFAEVRVEEP